MAGSTKVKRTIPSGGKNTNSSPSSKFQKLFTSTPQRSINKKKEKSQVPKERRKARVVVIGTRGGTEIIVYTKAPVREGLSAFIVHAIEDLKANESIAEHFNVSLICPRRSRDNPHEIMHYNEADKEDTREWHCIVRYLNNPANNTTANRKKWATRMAGFFSDHTSQDKFPQEFVFLADETTDPESPLGDYIRTCDVLRTIEDCFVNEKYSLGDCVDNDTLMEQYFGSPIAVYAAREYYRDKVDKYYEIKTPAPEGIEITHDDTDDFDDPIITNPRQAQLGAVAHAIDTNTDKSQV